MDNKLKINIGNKLPKEYDDPIDVYFKKIIDIIDPYFKTAGFTPNMITTLSFLFGALTCYFYYKKSYMLAGFLFIISYFFDVMDGYFARKYDMKSKFGSYYDVTTDFLIGALLIYLLLTNKNIIKLQYINIKFVILWVVSILMFLSFCHMGFQERYTKNTNKENVSDGLKFLNMIDCKNYEIMRYTKYFGTGLLSISTALIIYLHVFFTE